MEHRIKTIDISILRPGVDYKELRKTFVIFICNYDPFGRNIPLKTSAGRSPTCSSGMKRLR